MAALRVVRVRNYFTSRLSSASPRIMPSILQVRVYYILFKSLLNTEFQLFHSLDYFMQIDG
jgi:hypothetical protein